MNRISPVAKAAASRLALMALILTVVLAGCKKDSKADLDDLLKTVPAEAGMVAAYNLSDIAEKAGCKVDGDKIDLPAELTQAVASIKDPETKRRVQALLGGEAGMALTDQVVFASGYHVYITGLLSDPAKFEAFLSADGKPVSMKEKDGVRFSRDAAVIGNQFWLLTEGEIDPLDVKSMSELAENKSFLSTGFAQRLTDGDYTLRGMIATSSPLLGGGSFSKQASQMMVLQTLFSDAAYIDFSVEFRKDKAELVASVLNSKFKAAGYNFPVAKVKSDIVKSVAGSGSFGFAVGADGKFVEKVKAMLSQLGAMGQLYANTISSIDGTVAFIGDRDPAGEADMKLSGVIKTTGVNLNALTSTLDMFSLNWRKEADRLIVSSASAPSGTLTGEALAKEADGCILCVALSGKSLPAGYPFREVVVRLKPSDGGVALKATASVADTDTPVLLQIIKDRL